MGKYLFRVKGVNALSCNSSITSIFHGCGSDIVVSKSRFVEVVIAYIHLIYREGSLIPMNSLL